MGRFLTGSLVGVGGRLVGVGGPRTRTAEETVGGSVLVPLRGRARDGTRGVAAAVGAAVATAAIGRGDGIGDGSNDGNSDGSGDGWGGARGVPSAILARPELGARQSAINPRTHEGRSSEPRCARFCMNANERHLIVKLQFRV